MTNREHRRFIKSQIAESERLRGLVAGHPLMEPLLAQREDEFREELARSSAGGREPRTVLFFTGQPVYGSQGIDAQFAATILSHFLEMVKTEYSVEKHGRVGKRGPRKDEDEARLMITGLPRGSFGIELAQPQVDTLFGEEQLSNVLVRLTELFSAAGQSDEDFVYALDDVSPRVYSRLEEFFKVLNDHHANIRMQTGDLELELDQNKVSQALVRVSSLQTTDDEFDREGMFRGATLDTWRFDFRGDDGDTLSGRLSSDLDENQVVAMNLSTNQPCTARLKETRITTQGGASRTRYELLNLTPRNQQNQP